MVSRHETEAGLGGRKSTGDEQKQNAMWGQVGRERGDGVATVARHKVEGSNGMWRKRLEGARLARRGMSHDRGQCKVTRTPSPGRI